jgi:hypothetical protein
MTAPIRPMGTCISDVAPGASAVAHREKTLFQVSEPRSDALLCDKVSRYVFGLRGLSAT